MTDRYGPSRDLDSVELGPANPECRCNPMQAMMCPYGHMLECHYPKTCREADCQHSRRYREDEDG
jgi:hypothetical protein